MLYMQEDVVCDVSRSLGKPEKAEQQTRIFYSHCMSQKTYEQKDEKKGAMASGIMK